MTSAADGTHHIGMHSCYFCEKSRENVSVRGLPENLERIFILKIRNALISLVTVKNLKELINSAVMFNHMCQHVWKFI